MEPGVFLAALLYSWDSALTYSRSLVCVPRVRNPHRPTSLSGSRQLNIVSRTSNRSSQRHRSVSISRSVYSARHAKSGALAADGGVVQSANRRSGLEVSALGLGCME